MRRVFDSDELDLLAQRCQEMDIEVSKEDYRTNTLHIKILPDLELAFGFFTGYYLSDRWFQLEYDAVCVCSVVNNVLMNLNWPNVKEGLYGLSSDWPHGIGVFKVYDSSSHLPLHNDFFEFLNEFARERRKGC